MPRGVHYGGIPPDNLRRLAALRRQYGLRTTGWFEIFLAVHEGDPSPPARGWFTVQFFLGVNVYSADGPTKQAAFFLRSIRSEAMGLEIHHQRKKDALPARSKKLAGRNPRRGLRPAFNADGQPRRREIPDA